MAEIWRLAVGYVLLVNLAAFVVYGMDKRRAIQHQWRIPEKTLLGLALAGGSVGALLGMKVFRHKTKHWRFKICVPLFLVIHLVMIILWLVRQ